jgi:hypothetical protein
MTIDLDEGAERDDLALLTPTKRLHAIAQILAEGVRRQREDARRTGTAADIPQHQEREDSGLEPFGPVRLDRPLD